MVTKSLSCWLGAFFAVREETSKSSPSIKSALYWKPWPGLGQLAIHPAGNQFRQSKLYRSMRNRRSLAARPLRSPRAAICRPHARSCVRVGKVVDARYITDGAERRCCLPIDAKPNEQADAAVDVHDVRL